MASIDLQRVLYLGDEVRVLLRRDEPLGLQVRLEFVFFSVLEVVMLDIESAYPSSTYFPAIILMVQGKQDVGCSDGPRLRRLRRDDLPEPFPLLLRKADDVNDFRHIQNPLPIGKDKGGLIGSLDLTNY